VRSHDRSGLWILALWDLVFGGLLEFDLLVFDALRTSMRRGMSLAVIEEKRPSRHDYLPA
jgi:hypothetical protein